MHVARLSLTPVKGTAHVHPASLALTEDGPRDDRRFCLVDPVAARVLRTVDNPLLVACRAQYADRCLRIHFPDRTSVTGEVTAEPQSLSVDYWGRVAQVRPVTGPWSAAFSSYLGRDVVLVEAERPGEVVYGSAVTLLTTASLGELARRLGSPTDDDDLLVDSERFRSTVVVDTDDEPAFVEDRWIGAELALGSAVVRVVGSVPRCAVVRITPRSGARGGADPLRALAPDRTETNTRGQEVVFGVDAHVVRAGVVAIGDAVTCAAGDPSTPAFRSGVHARTAR